MEQQVRTEGGCPGELAEHLVCNFLFHCLLDIRRKIHIDFDGRHLYATRWLCLWTWCISKTRGNSIGESRERIARQLEPRGPDVNVLDVSHGECIPVELEVPVVCVEHKLGDQICFSPREDAEGMRRPLDGVSEQNRLHEHTPSSGDNGLRLQLVGLGKHKDVANLEVIPGLVWREKGLGHLVMIPLDCGEQSRGLLR